ncbi:MAG: IS1634 family transposase [Bacteroidales bacterium]|jgi:transposase|nr:IS1634 family transposase [Bacteroidales bacterium]
MSIYLDCFKNNGYDYLRIVDGRRHKKADGSIGHKRITIKNLGHLKKYDDGQGEGLLFRLREQFKRQELDIGMDYIDLYKKVEAEKKITIKNPVGELNSKNMGYFFLENIYNRLEINQVLHLEKSRSKLEYDLNGLTKLMVFGRILCPQSKKATLQGKDKYLFEVTESYKEKEIYRSLDVLHKKSESIQTRMNTKIKQSTIGRVSDLTYYDVTNYYFETLYGDEDIYLLDAEGEEILGSDGKAVIKEKGLRKKGVGKDGKPNPLVAMGLFIDRNGIPVSYNMFPGNTQDKTTFKEMIKTSLNKADLGKVVVVADNGMNAQENMYLLVTNGNGYIISKSAKKSWTAKPAQKEMQTIRDWALSESGYTKEYNDDGIMTFKYKSRTYDRTLKDSDGNSITIKEKEIIFWSKKQYEKSLRDNAKFIEYLESCKENPDKLKDKQRKSQEFIKVLQVDKKTGEVLKTKAVVILLEDKIQKQKELMGYYGIVTSETDMSDKDVINRYHGLSRIEDSFRIIKSDLEGRPIFVWTKEHINAHFLICFIALTIIRLIQHKVLTYLGEDTLNIDGWKQGITADTLKHTLNNFQANHIGDGFYQIGEINESIELLFKVWRQDFNLFLPDLSRLAGFKDKIAAFTL